MPPAADIEDDGGLPRKKPEGRGKNPSGEHRVGGE